jgi:hypothetical protein
MPELKNFKYKIVFAAKIRAIKPSEEDEKLAKASLDNLKGLLPDGIDPRDHPDLLYIVGNLTVANIANLNDAAIDTDTALSTYKMFENKPCDIEHDRGKVAGFIFKAGLSEFGSDKIITEDEARATGKAGGLFNITTVAVLWRVVNSQLCDFIEKSSYPDSPTYNALSLSFEVLFNDYNIAVGPSRLLKDCQIYSAGVTAFAPYDKMLKANEGLGKTDDDQFVFQVLIPPLIPAGQGIVSDPAAPVKGISSILFPTPKEIQGPVAGAEMNEPPGGLVGPAIEAKMKEILSKMIKEVKAFTLQLTPEWVEKFPKEVGKHKVMVTFDNGITCDGIISGGNLEIPYFYGMDDIENIESALPDKIPPFPDPNPIEPMPKHPSNNLLTDMDVVHAEEKKNIKQAKDSVSSITNQTIQKATTMKVSTLKDLKEQFAELVKPENHSEAIASMDVIADAITKESERLSNEKKIAEDKLTQAEADKKELVASQEALKAQLAEVQTKLEKVVQAQAAAEADAKFQARMAALSDEYELGDEERQVIVEDIRGLDDEAFAKWQKKFAILAKKSKKQPKKDDKKDGEKPGDKKDDKEPDDDEDDAKCKGNEEMDEGKHKKASKKDDEEAIKENEKKKVAAAALASAASNVTSTEISNDPTLHSNESLTDRAKRAFGSSTVGGRRIDGEKS